MSPDERHEGGAAAQEAEDRGAEADPSFARMRQLLGQLPLIPLPEGWQERVIESCDVLRRPTMRMHILVDGHPLCGFTRRPPSQWEAGHIFIKPEHYSINAKACADPDHPLHSIFRFEICPDCKRAHLASRKGA